jgi:hypothetical protein
MTTASEERTLRTDIPARLDRLSWSRFHWRIVIGLGTVWTLDGLEVTIVDADWLCPPRTSGPRAPSTSRACVGALSFGQLTNQRGSSLGCWAGEGWEGEFGWVCCVDR